MTVNYIENNVAVIEGMVCDCCTFSHEVYGEGFYMFYIEVPRLSDSYDRIPVLVSERIIVPSSLTKGIYVKVCGQFRSYNNLNNNDHKLVLTVFARELLILENGIDSKYPNTIELNGFICKPPIFRTTPSGREIADILLAVNRSYNKSDYIPCISWGRNARYCEKLKIGDNLKVWGRIQSREYQKKIDDETIEKRVAFEVSVSKLQVVIAGRQDEQTDNINS